MWTPTPSIHLEDCHEELLLQPYIHDAEAFPPSPAAAPSSLQRAIQRSFLSSHLHLTHIRSCPTMTCVGVNAARTPTQIPTRDPRVQPSLIYDYDTPLHHIARGPLPHSVRHRDADDYDMTVDRWARQWRRGDPGPTERSCWSSSECESPQGKSSSVASTSRSPR